MSGRRGERVSRRSERVSGSRIRVARRASSLLLLLLLQLWLLLLIMWSWRLSAAILRKLTTLSGEDLLIEYFGILCPHKIPDRRTVHFINAARVLGAVNCTL